MARLCICQICNCGRHKCPHQSQRVPDPSGQPCRLSEYTNKYVPYPMELTQSCKPPAQAYQSTVPLDDKTTNRADFIPHPLEKPYVHKPDEYSQPEGQIDAMTNYKNEYTEKPLDPRKPLKRDGERKVLGKFSGHPTYKNDYRKWPLSQREPVNRDPDYRSSSAPFEGNSNYTSDYIPRQVAPRKSMKPVETARESDTPFQGNTGYRDHFVKHPMPPRESRDKPQWEPNKVPLDGLSNYMRDYVPKGEGKLPSCKPDANAYQSDAPLEDATTHRVDYKKWPMERPYHKQPDEYTKPAGVMDLNTTSHTAYTKKPLDKTAPARPASRKRLPGKFDSATNYKEDFRKWPMGVRPQQTMKSDYVPNDAIFEGLPTYKSDYIKYTAPPRQSLKPLETARASDQPFDGKTGYRDEYIKHPMQAREKKEKPQWEGNPAKLDGLSNYMREFVPKDLTKQPSCKPNAAAYQSDAPLEDGTTHRTDYKKWPADRPYHKEPEQYVRPDGNMEMNTTSHTDYTKKPIERNAIIKPDSKKRLPGKFDGTTNYKEDFRKWPAGERPQQTMRGDYVPPEIGFEGRSNYQDDYIPRKIDPRRSMKPTAQGVNSDTPFDGNTEYRNEYQKKDVPPCPATIVDASPPQYIFKEQDPMGHKWYEPVSTSVVELPTASRMNSASRPQLTALSVA